MRPSIEVCFKKIGIEGDHMRLTRNAISCHIVEIVFWHEMSTVVRECGVVVLSYAMLVARESRPGDTLGILTSGLGLGQGVVQL